MTATWKLEHEVGRFEDMEIQDGSLLLTINGKNETPVQCNTLMLKDAVNMVAVDKPIVSYPNFIYRQLTNLDFEDLTDDIFVTPPIEKGEFFQKLMFSNDSKEHYNSGYVIGSNLEALNNLCCFLGFTHYELEEKVLNKFVNDALKKAIAFATKCEDPKENFSALDAGRKLRALIKKEYEDNVLEHSEKHFSICVFTKKDNDGVVRWGQLNEQTFQDMVFELMYPTAKEKKWLIYSTIYKTTDNREWVFI